MMKLQVGEDDTAQWLVLLVLLSGFVCRLPTDGAQMRRGVFYGLQETLDSIWPQRQITDSRPAAIAKTPNSLTLL